MTCFQAALVTGGSRGIDAASAVTASGAIVMKSDDRAVAEPLRREMSDVYGLAQIGCDVSEQ
jgi:hypothetical protein